VSSNPTTAKKKKKTKPKTNPAQKTSQGMKKVRNFRKLLVQKSAA
jgi:hypothetical protein